MCTGRCSSCQALSPASGDRERHSSTRARRAGGRAHRRRRKRRPSLASRERRSEAVSLRVERRGRRRWRSCACETVRERAIVRVEASWHRRGGGMPAGSNARARAQAGRPALARPPWQGHAAKQRLAGPREGGRGELGPGFRSPRRRLQRGRRATALAKVQARRHHARVALKANGGADGRA